MAQTGRFLRSLLLAAAVFAVAVSTGALLAAAAPASPDLAPELVGTSQATETAFDPTPAQSLVYSGAVALTVSVVGLVMVARRRRLW